MLDGPGAVKSQARIIAPPLPSPRMASILLVGESMGRRRILLVDDEGAVLFGFGEYLGDRGFTVVRARDVGGAMDRLATTPFDLLITDLHLDGNGPAGGLDVVSRAREVQPGIRVVVLTACDASLAAEAFRRGADQFLQKPQPLPRIADLAEALLQGLRP